MKLHPWLATGVVSLLFAGCPGPAPKPACPTDQSGVACVWAGNGTAGFNGDGKPARASRLYEPVDVAFGPDGTPWILDWNNHKVRTVEKDGTLKTRIGTILPGDGDPDQNDQTPAGAPGDTVSLNHPTSIAFEPDGTVILATWHNFKIRTCDPATDLVHVIAGGDYVLGNPVLGSPFGDGGPAARASFSFPKAIVRAPTGELYVLDQRNQRIRKMAADADRTITTVAGTGTKGFAGDGGDPLQAQFNWDSGVAPVPNGGLAIGPDGKLYVSDTLNNRVRVIDFAANVIDTLAGTGTAGFSGDGKAAKEAELSKPIDLEFGPDGRLYVADSGNGAIRAIDLTTGVITTVAGTGKNGTGAEGRAATKTQLNDPWGVSFDADGAMYVSDTMNNRILRVAR